MPTPTPVPTPNPGPKFLGSWLQYTGTVNLIDDVVSADYGQHLDVVPGEVVLIPFEVAVILLAQPQTPWVPMTVIPDTLTSTRDGASGLDQIWVASTDCWGLSVSGGYPYFEPDIGAAPGERMRLLVIGGKPYLTNDL